MDSNETFKFYGNYDVTRLLEIIEENNLDWNKFTIRQRACTDMKYTQTIPIVYDEDFFETNYTPIFTDNFPFFEEELKKISEIIKSQTNNEGYLLRAILTKLYKIHLIMPSKRLDN